MLNYLSKWKIAEPGTYRQIGHRRTLGGPIVSIKFNSPKSVSTEHESNSTIDKRQSQNTARLKWVVGTPYFVQGTKDLAEIPILFFIKFSLGLGDAGGQLFDSLKGIGWMAKPLWGSVSDKIHIFGYHRKAWYVLMACLGVIFWITASALAFAEVSVPFLYLFVFNLVFGTYAFVDVVCDAIMVVEGRRLKRVSSFVNLQWTVLSVSNAGALFLGGRLQEWVENGDIHIGFVFALAGFFPLLTAIVGFRNIEEEKIIKQPLTQTGGRGFTSTFADILAYLLKVPSRLNHFRKENHTIWLLLIFLFFWKFSPSVGFIERSYLIDERGFSARTFGIILAFGGLTFLASVLSYRWTVNRFPSIKWHHYLYGMVAIGVLSFPISFFLYLEPDHPWWRYVYFTVPEGWNPLPEWTRYEWFRLISGNILSFASIPAFMIPLTINAYTVKIAYAGLGYALLTAFSNATNILEGVVGAILYELFSGEGFKTVISGFHGTAFDFAGQADSRTLILEIFVYIGLVFTLLTIPFIEMLRRELLRKKINVKLNSENTES